MSVSVICGAITRDGDQLQRCVRDVTHRGEHFVETEPVPCDNFMECDVLSPGARWCKSFCVQALLDAQREMGGPSDE